MRRTVARDTIVSLSGQCHQSWADLSAQVGGIFPRLRLFDELTDGTDQRFPSVQWLHHRETLRLPQRGQQNIISNIIKKN